MHLCWLARNCVQYIVIKSIELSSFMKKSFVVCLAILLGLFSHFPYNNQAHAFGLDQPVDAGEYGPHKPLTISLSDEQVAQEGVIWLIELWQVTRPGGVGLGQRYAFPGSMDKTMTFDIADPTNNIQSGEYLLITHVRSNTGDKEFFSVGLLFTTPIPQIWSDGFDMRRVYNPGEQVNIEWGSYGLPEHTNFLVCVSIHGGLFDCDTDPELAPGGGQPVTGNGVIWTIPTNFPSGQWDITVYSKTGKKSNGYTFNILVDNNQTIPAKMILKPDPMYPPLYSIYLSDANQVKRNWRLQSSSSLLLGDWQDIEIYPMMVGDSFLVMPEDWPTASTFFRLIEYK